MSHIDINLVHDLGVKSDWSDKFGLRSKFLHAWLFTAVKVMFIFSLMNGAGALQAIEDNIALLDQYIRNDFSSVQPSSYAALNNGRKSPTSAQFGTVAAVNDTIYNNTGSVDYSPQAYNITESYIEKAVQFHIARAVEYGFILGNGTSLRGCLQADEYGMITGKGSDCRLRSSGGGGGSSSSTTALAMGDTLTGATEGSILFAGPSGVLSQDNTNFFWDDTANRLGLGDNTPAAALTVGSGDAFQVNSTGAIAAATGITSSGTITFTSLAGGGTQCLQTNNSGVISATGSACGSGGSGDSISINGSAATDANFINTAASGTTASVTWALNTVTAPDEVSLTIGTASATEAGIITTGTQTLAGAKTFTSNVTAAKADPSIILDVATASDTDFWLGVQDDAEGDDDDVFQIGGGTTPGTNPFLTINTLGNVGIGTASPSEMLEVNGNIAFSSGTARTISIVSPTGDTYGSNLAISAQNGSDISGPAIETGGSLLLDGGEGVNFGLNGNVLIGTINPSNVGIGDATPASLLTVGSGDLFQVNSSGAIAAAVGITSAGGNVSLNNNSNFTTSISTGTSTGAISLGGGSNTVAVNSSSWDISTAGVASGLTGLTSSGTITLSSLGGGGTQCVQTSNTGVLSATACATGGSQTPWTSDIDAAGYNLQNISNLEFQNSNAAPAGSTTAIYATSGRLIMNAIGSRSVIITIDGVDEYDFSETTLDLKGNTITNGAWEGTTVDVSYGGTGATTFTTNGVLYGNSTSPIQATAQGGANTVLIANNGAPSFSSAITVGTSVTSPAINATTALQLNGTSINTAGTLSNVAYLNQANIFSANQTITKADPALVLNVTTATDTDFWIGVTDDGDGVDDDLFQIGDGSTPGTNPFLTMLTSGYVGIGDATPLSRLDVRDTSGSNTRNAYFGPTISSFSATSQGYINTAMNAVTALNNTTRGSALLGLNQSNTSNAQLGSSGVVESLHSTGTKGFAGAINGDAYSTAAGNTSIFYGAGGYAQHTGSGTVSVMASLYGWSNFRNGAGTVSLNAGLYLGAQTGVANTAANNYQIYSASAVPFVARADGNVGVGTITPASLLAVGSTSQFQVNSSGAIAASTGIASSGGYTQTGTTANTFTGTTTFSNATYSALFTGGNVGIGDATPERKLDVEGDAASNYIASFFNDGNNANRYGIEIQGGADDGSGTTYYLNALDGDGTQVGYIARSGGTFALTDVSDRRTKTNIQNTDMDAMEILTGLRVVDFNRLSDPNGAVITGFIAQEVQDVYPQIVTVGENGYLGITKENLIPVLVKGFQNQQDQLTALQNQVNALQGNAGGNISANTPLVLAHQLYLSEDSIGQAKILEGETEVRVSFTRPYQYMPIATATPLDFIDSAYRITDTDADGFTIELKDAQSEDVMFNWHAFAGEAAKLTVSDGSSSTISFGATVEEEVLPEQTPEQNTETEPQALPEEEQTEEEPAIQPEPEVVPETTTET